MYFQNDWARTWYDSGAWFDAHPELELRDKDGQFVSVVEYNHSFRAYDFGNPTAQEAWVNASMVLVAQGACDGVFVDGYRGPIWRFELLKDCAIEKQTEWINGMNRATDLLAARLGPNRLLVNNPYSAARPSANGVMIEFFGRNFVEPSSEKPGNLLIDIELLQAEGRIGRFIAAHMNSNDRTHFNATLAAFLAGAEQNAYIGTGTEWEDCDNWATPRGAFDGRSYCSAAWFACLTVLLPRFARPGVRPVAVQLSGGSR
jgi:hypothetical protein